MRIFLSLLLLFTTCIAVAQKPSKKFKKKLEEAIQLAQTNDCNAIADVAALLQVHSDENFGLWDMAESIKWLQKGYELNCPRATCDLAAAILQDSNGKEFDSAVNVLARAGAMGYAEADYKMGVAYLYGYGDYYLLSGVSPEWNTKPYSDSVKRFFKTLRQ